MSLDTYRISTRISRPVDSSQLRNHPAYQCPDREAWTRQHGFMPFAIPAAEHLKTRAASLVEKDWSTLSQKEAISLRTEMDELCESVGIDYTEPPYVHPNLQTLPPPTHVAVFYDPELRQFFVFARA